jgi:hypothetical protein
MSCLGPNYNPNPTRLWSRFENTCVYAGEGLNPNDMIYVPMLQRYISVGSLGYELAVLQKGNILQYKKNSSNITKKQRYAQIARGNWTNRTTTWASQTETYTNPNTNMLQRVNYSSITADGTPTIAPITRCPLIPPKKDVSFIPPPISSNGLGGGGIDPVKKIPILPPPLPPIDSVTGGQSPTSVLLPPPTIPVVIPNIIIPDGGTLVCNTFENTCTGEVQVKIISRQCNPSSASDVPGPIVYFCYDDSLPTYYPKTRRTYLAGANSTFPIPSDTYDELTPIISEEIGITDITDTFDKDIISLVDEIKHLLSLFLDHKYVELNAIFTPVYYGDISTRLYDLSKKYKNMVNKTSIIDFVSKTVQLLYKSSSQSITNLSLQSEITTSKDKVDELYSILHDAVKLRQYLSARSISIIDTVEIISLELDIPPEYLIYNERFGVPKAGDGYDPIKMGEILDYLKNPSRTFI